MDIISIIEKSSSLGVVLIMAYLLLNQTLKEKKEDRDLYRQSVESFNCTIQGITKELNGVRMSVDNVEKEVSDMKEDSKRMEEKINKILTN